jgi:hypothetical protein
MLTPKQVALLARKVREDREAQMKASLSMFWRAAKIPAEKSGPAEKVLMGKIKLEEDVLLPEAHPQKVTQAWAQTFTVLESSLPELSLTEEETAALRKFLEQWKPRSR